tara:strand:+ start:513 stop:1478 length:966 start_codon:yes stop_codon:yes gene_type:complete
MKKEFNKIAGLTLIEILIGIVVSSLMMAAIYSTYSIVNNTYNQVIEKAKISRSSRDLIELLIRDTRMAGFKYYLGINTLGYPKETYLNFGAGDNTIQGSHDPIVIIPAEQKGLGHYMGDVIADYSGDLDGAFNAEQAIKIPDYKSKCCDKIHIVYDDFNQNDSLQPYKRYKVTYYALSRTDGGENRYAIYKSKIEWQQARTSEEAMFPKEGKWIAYPDCAECYHNQLVRDYVDDMEFIPIGKEGQKIAYPDPTTSAGRESLYNLRAVDIRIAFKSKRDFFRSINPDRSLKGFSKDAVEFNDRKLRDNVVVTVYTRNIGSDL